MFDRVQITPWGALTFNLLHGEGPYHIETSPLICSANGRDLRYERVLIGLDGKCN